MNERGSRPRLSGVTIRVSAKSRDRLRVVRNHMSLSENTEISMDQAMQRLLDLWEKTHSIGSHKPS